jgi:hypothetical protein
MSDQDYIYGVFSAADKIPEMVSQLHRAGLKTSEICVLGNKSEQFNTVSGKIKDPTAKSFVWFGIGGAIAGLIAGIAVSLHIPGVNGFQLIVPLMGTVSGGACFPYVICQLAMFLTANNPQHWAHVFEGTVEGGSVIIMAEPQSFDQKRSAMDILMAHNPIEMIFRKSQWGVSASQVAEQPLSGRTASQFEKQVEVEREERITAVA